MKDKRVDDPREQATSLRHAVRLLFDAHARPTAERRRLLRLADALDRLLTALDDAADSSSDVTPLAAAHAELRQVLPHTEALLPSHTRAALHALDLALADRVAKRSRNNVRGGSVALRSPLPLAPQPAAAAAPDARDAPLDAAAQPVRFGASAPQRSAPGQTFVARFVAYPPDAARAAADALGRSPGLARSVGVGSAEIQPGTRLRVALSAPGLRVEDAAAAHQDLVWRGDQVLLEFGVEVPARLRATSTLLKFDVSIDGLLLARLRLALEISRAAAAAPAPLQQHMDRALARTAFASYSSKDRERVLDRVAAIRIAAGTDIFLDCHDLRPGDRWNQVLADEIDRREAFMLFWSSAAAASPWVTWEWQRAIDAKGLDGIQVHPLENGVEVPRALEGVHLGDPAMDLRAAHLARQPRGSRSTQGVRR